VISISENPFPLFLFLLLLSPPFPPLPLLLLSRLSRSRGAAIAEPAKSALSAERVNAFILMKGVSECVGAWCYAKVVNEGVQYKMK
jgi:hypothetical protein